MCRKRAGPWRRLGAAYRGPVAGGVLVVCLCCCTVAGAAQIASGGGHACLVMSSGHIDCWGNNDAGVLGNGTRATSQTPVEVQGVTDAVQVSAGESDSCAVLSTGRIDCWGDNSSGALGDGTEAAGPSDTPVEVRGVTNATQVAVGSEHSCALLSSGHVDCWGAEQIDAIVYPRDTPVEVQGIDDATQVAAGRSDSCALLSNGHVECWEENYRGQLGDGSTSASEVPVEVRGLTTATQIAAGSEHSCALLSSGHVSCWGDNQSGQLGDGTSANADVPAEVQGVTSATQVAAGGDDSCALMSNSRIDCWGANYYGQLGNGTIASSDTPVEVEGVTTASQVAASSEHSCALLSGGYVSCWGDNELDQLGDGVNGGNRDTPIGVRGLTQALQVSVDDAHSCALLRSGHVECWGENLQGQLGDGTTERSQAPVEVRDLTNAMQLSEGESDSCAVLSSGHVDCWGRAPFGSGQLGDGTNEGSDTPVEVRGLTGATQVATATDDSCALLSSGHIDCWGDNEEGELGDGATGGYSDTPVEVPGITNATEIASGAFDFCALLSGGHVDCWGSNTGGQLGNGSDLASDTPVEVHGLTDVTQIAAGYELSCALLSSGHIDCWGDNERGELGDGTATGPEYCYESEGPCSKIPVEVQTLGTGTQVAVGGGDSCALLSSGHVDCWGSNVSGQLGDGSAAGPGECGEYYACDYWDTPVEVQGLTDAIQVAAGGGDSCALLSIGQVDCWGSSDSGALGDGLAWSTVPVGVFGFAPVVPAGGPPVAAEPSAGVVGPVTPEGAGVASAGTPSHASLLSPSATATKEGKLLLTLSCSHGTSACTGTISITILERLKHHRHKTVLLAAARYTLRAGGGVQITLTLSSFARALLARGHALHATATVTSLSGAAHTKVTGRLTIHAAEHS